MIYSLKLIGVLALLFLGAWGWGTAFVGLLRRAGWRSVRDELGPPMQILLGVGLFLAIGGILVAVDAARVGVLLTWHLIGICLLLARLVLVRRNGTAALPSLATGLAIAVVGVVLTILSLGVAIGVPQFNANDDDPAYIYLAKRLTSTGGLLDPFNLRRLTGYGGNTLYQSIFLRISGTSSLRGFELMFASLLLVLVAIGTTRRRWLGVGGFLLGIGILFGHGIGAVSNLSPNFSVAALSLGVFQALRHVRRSSDRDEPLLYVVVGILLAGILALRFSFLLSVGITVFVVVFALRGKNAVKPFLVIGGTVAICTAGWADAMFRSSRSLLFPLMAGNSNASWPTGQNPLVFAHGLGTFAHFAWRVFTTDSIGWVALGATLVGLAFLVSSRGESTDMLVVCSAGVGCVVQIVTYSYSLSGSYSLDVARLNAPSTLACGLLLLGLLWPEHAGKPAASSPATMTAGIPARPARAAHVRKGAARRPYPTATVTVVIVLGGAILTFGSSLSEFAHKTGNALNLGSQVLAGSSVVKDPNAPFEAEYRQLNSIIPPGAKVFAAVEHPALLSFTKYQFATLDVVGAASPPPHMPFFEGPLAKVEYLRRLGYQYVVADPPSLRGLYNVKSWYDDVFANVYAYRQWAPYLIDWQSTVKALEQNPRFRVRYVGQIALIRLG